MRRISFLLLSCFLLTALLFSNLAQSQIYINEFLASNTGSIIDPDFQESADWIELYNAGNATQNLGGYFLTDNFGDKEKWKIPAGVQIQANGYLLIWADGKNTGLHTTYKISADGEELALFSPAGVLLDSITFGLQEPNISMGRKTDGNIEWAYFTNPTPGQTNASETFTGIVHNTPRFSVLGGIFSSPVSLEISNTFGGEIRFTLDGSEPNENSPLVNGPVLINSTTIVRARILQNGKVPGEIITHSYFIDIENKIGTLPVFSIATNAENFWDSEKGIYEQDFKPEWEIPVNLELFENDGSDRAGFNLMAGMKINGLYSWQLPQKMLGVYFRKEYGKGKLEYPLLFDHNQPVFDNFALRASGSDWAFTLFRDGMIQTLPDENMDVDFQGIRPCVVYVNGQYMGIHNIRSKINEDFIVQNHQLGDEKIDMIENENYVETGSLDQYAQFETIYHKDLTVQANYDEVANLMDIDNFTDFIITEIYSQNTSVDHNIMAWKPQSSGKWKWILNDLDRGFFKPGNNLINFYANRNVIPFSQLLTNENYRHYFGKRLADHLFTSFDPARVITIIDAFKAKIQDEVPHHIQRWQGTSSSYGDPISSVEYWNNEVEKLKSFANSRPGVLLNDLKNYGFSDSKSLSISMVPANAGVISFNGINIKQEKSVGAYPANETISLLAKAKDGFIFQGWQQLQTTSIIGKEQIWKYNDTGNEMPENWNKEDFDDSDWEQGAAELGYGDGDESTLLDYGGVANNKIITTYFRKGFELENIENIESIKIKLKCDDGAVVYINGTEAIRENLPSGEISRLTHALIAVGGSDESDFTLYSVDAGLLKSGQNCVAVEIHQANTSSSDISFDLELETQGLNPNETIGSNANYAFTHSSDLSLVAVFESDGSCTVPEEITSEIILNKACSPYRVPNHVLF